jgi:hypothetical protein
MPQKKPTAVVVIAILQVVFGLIGLCGTVVQLSGAQKALLNATQVNQPQGQANVSPEAIQSHLEKKIPNYHAIETGDAVVDLVLCVLMLVSAVGLLQMRSWGRLLALGYAVLSILAHLASVVLTFALVVPAMADLSKEIAASGGQEAQVMAQAMRFGIIFAALAAALTAIYPIIVLIVLCLPSVRAAFAGVAMPAGPEDYRDPNAPGTFPETDDRFQPGGPEPA